MMQYGMDTTRLTSATLRCREIKSLVVAACMRLKQRAFQRAAFQDWGARASNVLAFKRQAALEQARSLLDRSFSTFSKELVGCPLAQAVDSQA